MVTGIPTAPCTNPYGDYLLSLSIQNKQDYARLHSYELHLMSQAVTSHIRAGPWQKIGFIQKVCSSGKRCSVKGASAWAHTCTSGHSPALYLFSWTTSSCHTQKGTHCRAGDKTHWLSMYDMVAPSTAKGGRISGRDHLSCHASRRR